MYTSYIGKKFLHLYNEREGMDLSAEAFFEKIFFEIFFNDPKHLMHVHGSSFFQKVSPKSLNNDETPEEFRLRRLQTDIENGKISGSTYVGYAAETNIAITSGQVSTLPIEINREEMYASWMGEALGIGVSGGYVILIDQPIIIMNLFEGWNYYREYLKQTPNVKDKQIETWNGHWFNHVFSKKYNPNDPWENFKPETNEVQGNIAIPTQPWSSIVFSLSRKYQNQEITAYCYGLSKTNTTLGFINLKLPEVRKLHQFRKKIFLDADENVLKEEEVEKLETFFDFKDACKMGVIGLKALEPDKLRTYMPKGTFLYAQGKEFTFKDDKSYFNYQLYKLWILAMLNKSELLNLASEVARALLQIEANDERGKKIFTTLSKEVREARTLKNFIEKLTDVLANDSLNAEIFKEVVQQVLKMPSDNFPLFVTLIRFEYQYQKSIDKS